MVSRCMIWLVVGVLFASSLYPPSWSARIEIRPSSSPISSEEMESSGGGGRFPRSPNPGSQIRSPAQSEEPISDLINAIVKEKRVECKGCARNMQEAQLDHATFLRLMLEKEKQKILKKLRMKAAPNITRIIRNEELPGPLANGHMINPAHNLHAHDTDSDLEDFYGKTEQIIVFPEAATSNATNERANLPSACLTFHLPKEIVGEKNMVKVSSAELWVYTNPDMTYDKNQHLAFGLTETMGNDCHNGHRILPVGSRHNVGNNEGWETLNLTSTLEDWINKKLHSHRGGMEHMPLSLQIGCLNCSKYSSQSPIDITLTTNRPFLVINVAGTTQKRRRRRNTDCQPGMRSECCRESFKVSFREIGLNSITHPPEYEAFYCKGSCVETNSVTLSTSSHTTMLQRSAQRSSLIGENRTTEVAPCCTAQKWREISVMVQNADNTLTQQLLPKMVVESCGCN